MATKQPAKTAASIGATMAPPAKPQQTGPNAPPPSPSTALRRPDNGIARDAKPQLEPMGLEQAEFMRAVWFAEVAHGVRPEDVLEPTFWAHHAVKFQPRARIEVWAKDGSWMAEYVVLDCSRTWAKVAPVLGPVRLTTGDVSETQAAREAANEELEKAISRTAKDYTVEFNNADKWRVIRNADKVVVTKGWGHQDDASKWLRAQCLHELGKGKPADEVVPH